MSTYVAAADRQQQNQRWGEIDRLFAESFPNAAQTAKRLVEDLVPPTSSVLLNKAEEDQHTGEQDMLQDSFGTTRNSEERTRSGMRTPTQEILDGTVLPSELTSDDVGMSDGSFFTADLPAEVLMFLGQGHGQYQGLGQDGKDYYDGCLKSHDREDSRFDAFADAEFHPSTSNDLSAENSADVQNPTVSQHQPTWSDELDAYLDSSAWLDFCTTDEQASAFT
ncbi:hypothetical protein E4U21_004299 [Claviceps maximensis]|nr:hypothetical protein E4U21_004299 [Claviceps maximensis]